MHFLKFVKFIPKYFICGSIIMEFLNIYFPDYFASSQKNTIALKMLDIFPMTSVSSILLLLL